MRRWVIGFTALFLFLLGFNIIPELRGGWGWRWPYQSPTDWQAVGLLVGLLIGYIVGTYFFRHYVAPSLIWSIGGGLVLSIAVQNIHNDPFFLLFSHTVSPVQTGASTIAVQYMGENGVQETLTHWPNIMQEAKDKNIIHFTTSPPGQALLHHWIAQLTDPLTPLSRPISMTLRPYQCSTLEVMRYTRGELTSAGFAMFMPLWAAFAVLPIFFAAKDLTGSQETALRVSQWWPLIPSLLLFAPTWSTFYPVLTVSAFACLNAGLLRDKMGLCVVAGLVMSVATFLNFAVLPILGLLGFYALGYWLIHRRTKNFWPLKVGLWFLLGLSTIWLIFGLYSGITPYDILQVTFDQHLDIERSYIVWLLLHPYDMLMFAGWPVATLALWGLWQAIQHLRKKTTLSQSDLLVLSLLLTVIILDLTGITRGESARIWLFFVPFVLLAGVEFFKWSIHMPLFVAQAATVAVMGSVLPVVAFDMKPLVESPRSDVPLLEHLELRLVNARFESSQYAGSFVLDGYRFIADPAQQTLTIELQWLGDEQVERPYQFELIAYAENEIDGEIVSAPFYWFAQDGNYLPTCWQDRDRIHDVIVMPLPPVSQPVVWELGLRAIDERTGDIATVTASDGRQLPHVVLGPINYP